MRATTEVEGEGGWGEGLESGGGGREVSPALSWESKKCPNFVKKALIAIFGLNFSFEM